jgi:hypothetical protein
MEECTWPAPPRIHRKTDSRLARLVLGEEVVVENLRSQEGAGPFPVSQGLELDHLEGRSNSIAELERCTSISREWPWWRLHRGANVLRPTRPSFDLTKAIPGYFQRCPNLETPIDKPLRRSNVHGNAGLRRGVAMLDRADSQVNERSPSFSSSRVKTLSRPCRRLRK